MGVINATQAPNANKHKKKPNCLCSRTMTAQDSRIMTAKISQIIDQPRIKARAKKKPHCLHAMGDMA